MLYSLHKMIQLQLLSDTHADSTLFQIATHVNSMWYFDRYNIASDSLLAQQIKLL